MKNINITLQPLSLLVGAAIVGLSLVTSGAFTPQGSSSTRDVSAIEITNQPSPNDYFSIRAGTPYVVPSGKTFVLTGLGKTGPSGYAGLSVDGQVLLETYCDFALI